MGRTKAIILSAFITTMLAAGAHGAAETNATAEVKTEEPLKIGHVVFEGGDGSSMEHAVVIKNAKNEAEGVDAESKWIGKIHPGWRKGDQVLLGNEGKMYDRIEYTTPDKQTKTIYFDITDFFGKF